VTSFDSGNGPDPIDPDFAGLFRPDDPAGRPGDESPYGSDDQPHFEPIVDEVADPRDDQPSDGGTGADTDSADAPDPVESPVDDQPPTPSGPAPDTGRLFRSQGVTDNREAVLALSSTHFGRLRTLERVQDQPPVLAAAGPVAIVSNADAVSPSVAPGGEPVPEEAAMTRRERRRQAATQRSVGHGAGTIGAWAVYLIVLGVTVLVGFANALLTDGEIGWPTGIVLVATSIYAALTVRREDDAVAIIVPPIAFLLVALTAAQLFLGSTEGSLLNRAVIVFFTLADNWYWIIGATVAALVIVLVRRRRS
jgi:hypothetical protein